MKRALGCCDLLPAEQEVSHARSRPSWRRRLRAEQDLPHARVAPGAAERRWPPLRGQEACDAAQRPATRVQPDDQLCGGGIGDRPAAVSAGRDALCDPLPGADEKSALVRPGPRRATLRLHLDTEGSLAARCTSRVTRRTSPQGSCAALAPPLPPSPLWAQHQHTTVRRSGARASGCACRWITGYRAPVIRLKAIPDPRPYAPFAGPAGLSAPAAGA